MPETRPRQDHAPACDARGAPNARCFQVESSLTRPGEQREAIQTLGLRRRLSLDRHASLAKTAGPVHLNAKRFRARRALLQSPILSFPHKRRLGGRRAFPLDSCCRALRGNDAAGNIAAVLDRPKAVALGSALPEGVGASRDGKGRATPPWSARAACREFRHFRLAATIAFYISENALSYRCSAASAPAAAEGLRWTAARWTVRRGPARRRSDILDLVISGHACEAIAATLTLRVKTETDRRVKRRLDAGARFVHLQASPRSLPGAARSKTGQKMAPKPFKSWRGGQVVRSAPVARPACLSQPSNCPHRRPCERSDPR